MTQLRPGHNALDAAENPPARVLRFVGFKPTQALEIKQEPQTQGTNMSA